MKLSKAMCLSRKTRMTLGNGEAWFYVCRGGLEICVANKKGDVAENGFIITKAQLKRALEIMEE